MFNIHFIFWLCKCRSSWFSRVRFSCKEVKLFSSRVSRVRLNRSSYSSLRQPSPQAKRYHTHLSLLSYLWNDFLLLVYTYYMSRLPVYIQIINVFLFDRGSRLQYRDSRLPRQLKDRLLYTSLWMPMAQFCSKVLQYSMATYASY